MNVKNLGMVLIRNFKQIGYCKSEIFILLNLKGDVLKLEKNHNGSINYRLYLKLTLNKRR